MSRPRRLVAYHLVFVLAVLLSAAALMGVWSHYWNETNRAARAYYTKTPSAAYVSPPTTMAQWLDSAFPLLPSRNALAQFTRNPLIRSTLLTVLLVVAWPWLSAAGLLIFQISMRRRRIRAVHMVRCVVYSADVTILFALALAAAAGVEANDLLVGRRGSNAPTAALLVSFVVVPLFAYRLWVAVKRYLRFDRPFATVLAVQVIVGLIALIAIVWGLLITHYWW
jgi:hypothetical protein